MRQSALRELRNLDPAGVEQVRIQLLDRCFPPAERMTPEEIRETYVTASDPPPSAVVLDRNDPIAVMLGEWFQDRRVLLLTYLAVEPARRDQGLGEYLMSDVLASWYRGAGALTLAEVEDPRFHSAHPDRGDPEARLRFYERLGADLLPLSYFQPSLRPASPRVPGMLLLRLAGRVDPPELLRSFLAEYFNACEPDASRDDPRVAALLTAALNVGKSGVTWSTSRHYEVPELPDVNLTAARTRGH
jgi:GNAT superfamily N-acetyltransferase